jgi:hypothetical protein
MLKKVKIYLSTYYNAIHYDKSYNAIRKTKLAINKYIVCCSSLSNIEKKHSLVFWILWKLFLFFFPILLLTHHIFNILISLTSLFVVRKREYQLKRLFLLIGDGIIKTGSRISILQEDDYCLVLPMVKKSKLISKNKQISVFNVITYKQIIKSCFYAFWAVIPVIKTFGYKNCIYLFNAYKWFLFFETLDEFDEDVDLYTDAQSDRWAILIDNARQKRKFVIQHGTLMQKKILPEQSDYFKYDKLTKHYFFDLPQKLNYIYKLFAFSETEAQCLLKAVINNKPDVEIIGYGLKLTPISKKNFSILIICSPDYNHYMFSLKIIEKLKNLDINIYIKPHPLSKIKEFYKLNKFDKVFVDNKIFPDVSLVISYYSTLAYQYESLNTNVIYYDEIDLSKIDDIIRSYYGRNK